jgi:hypothetical protein
LLERYGRVTGYDWIALSEARARFDQAKRGAK